MRAVTMGMQIAIISDEERGHKKKILIDYLYRHLGTHRVYAFKYFFCELLCLVNIITQMYLTDQFFDGEFLNYGIDVIKYTQREQSERLDPMIYIFPRMTKCTFHSYGSSGDVQRRDALCLLPLNVVNEKIYIFIWFWFLFLTLLTMIVIIFRLFILFATRLRPRFLHTRCRFSNIKELRTICKYGNIGDFFVLYLLGKNLDPIIMQEVTQELSKRLDRSVITSHMNGDLRETANML